MIHEFVKCFTAHQCKNNCQTKLIFISSDYLKLAQNNPLNQAFPGSGTAKT